MSSITILTVDDDPVMRRLIHTSLDNGRRTIWEASTALEGLRIAREKVPDVLLLDIGLPGHFDGFSLCEAMSKEPRFVGVHIVVISGYDDAEDIALARRHGASAYLVKPFRPNDLQKLIEHIEFIGNDMEVISPGHQTT